MNERDQINKRNQIDQRNERDEINALRERRVNDAIRADLHEFSPPTPGAA